MVLSAVEFSCKEVMEAFWNQSNYPDVVVEGVWGYEYDSTTGFKYTVYFFKHFLGIRDVF